MSRFWQIKATPGQTLPWSALLNQCSTATQIEAIMPEKQTVKEANSQILLRLNVESSPNPNPSKSVHETALTLRKRKCQVNKVSLAKQSWHAGKIF
jgi:hypothetical protein